LYEHQKVRTHWDEKEEKWYISVIDEIEILTGTDRSRKYLNDLKTKLKKKEVNCSKNLDS
jgi:hypothetical protein